MFQWVFCCHGENVVEWNGVYVEWWPPDPSGLWQHSHTSYYQILGLQVGVLETSEISRLNEIC